MLFPLQIYGTLQGLHLVPALPLFPHPAAFFPFTPSSPLSFRSWSSLLSPHLLPLMILRIAIGRLHSFMIAKVYAYIRASLPKPYNPDKYSIAAAGQGGLDDEDIPGLAYSIHNDSGILGHLANDLQSIGRTWQYFYDNWMLETPTRIGQILQGRNVLGNNLPWTNLHPLNVNPPPSPCLPQIASRPSSPGTDFNQHATPSSSSRDTFSASTSRPSTPGPPIEIMISSVSSGAQHVDFQIPTRNSTGEPAFSTNFSSPPVNGHGDRPRIFNSQPYHRVTALTALSADSLALHLSSHITDVLMMPLEALWVRCVALAFLSSPAAGVGAQAAAARWKREIYPLGGWFGMGLRGGWRGIGDYISKMVLLTGLEMGFGMIVWQASTAFSWFCGVRKFGWGTL